MSNQVNPSGVDAGLERAPDILRAAGFGGVPSGVDIAQSTDWMLKLANVLILRNINKLERQALKDVVKIIVDVQNSFSKLGGGNSDESFEVLIHRILQPETEGDNNEAIEPLEVVEPDGEGE